MWWVVLVFQKADYVMYEYSAELVRVIDGDTVVLRVDCGFRLHFEDRFRLYGIDTPETRGVLVETKRKGDAATVEVARLLALGPLTIKTYKPDKYGRWLAELFVHQADGVVVDVCQSLVAGGFAKVYLP